VIKFTLVRTMKDFKNILRNKINVDDHVVILPSKDEKQSVLNYMLKSMEETNTYPEYFHFNSCNMLDGFLSQKHEINVCCK
jgi:hypothetical protein